MIPNAHINRQSFHMMIFSGFHMESNDVWHIKEEKKNRWNEMTKQQLSVAESKNWTTYGDMFVFSVPARECLFFLSLSPFVCARSGCSQLIWNFFEIVLLRDKLHKWYFWINRLGQVVRTEDSFGDQIFTNITFFVCTISCWMMMELILNCRFPHMIQ